MLGIRPLSLVFFLPLVAWGTELTNGVPTGFAPSGAGLLRGGSGYQITAPSQPTRLEVRVATNSPDTQIDLFIRFDTDVGAGGESDCQVVGSGTVVLLYGVQPICQGQPLRAGTYYIAIRVAAAVQGTLMAVIDTTPQNARPARQIASGIAAAFNFGSLDNPPKLFNGAYSYAVEVPSNGTNLVINLSTDQLGADVDLHVRRGADVTSINIADYNATTSSGNESITIGPSSSPPLAPGVFYISLRLKSNGIGVTGTVTATVSTPAAPTITPLTSGVAAPFNFAAVTSPALVGNFRLNVPAGVGTLRFQLVTSTPGANVDLYVRFGQPVGDTSLATSKSEGATGDEAITLNGTPFQPIQPGDYYVSLRILTTGIAVTGTVTGTWSTGPLGPAIDATPTSLDFGSVPASLTRDLLLTIRNVGSGTLTVNSFTSSNPNFAAVGLALPLNLASSGQQAVLVRFTAPGLGSQSGTLTITSNDLNRPSISISVTGTGSTIDRPSLSVSPSLDFGTVNVNQSRDVPLAIRNIGSLPLTISSITSTNSQFTVVPPAPPFTISATGQQDVTIRFSPTAVGAQSGALTIASNDPGSPSATVTVTGNGQGGGVVITLSTPSLTFNAQQGTNPPSQRLTVRNSGTGTLTFRVASNQPWLTPSPASGTSTGNEVAINVNVIVIGLNAGTFNGELRITEDAGPGVVTVPVQLTVTAATQCPPGPGGTPTVTRGAIVNAASFTSSVLPNGSIARGAIFSVFGNNIGPTALQQPARFPLETTLGCVSVRITQGSAAVDAIPLAAIAGQVNAIMPSNAPIGDATITVTFNGRTSAAVPVKIVAASFGAFTVNQNGMGPGIIQNFVSQTEQPINSPQRPARLRQVETLWGTGLGGINAPDNVAPPAGDLPTVVEILVGGKIANKLYSGRGPCCAGLDQIVFEVPPDAPLGCYVPVLVRAGGVTSNTVTMAISSDGSRCTDPANPLSRFSGGGKIGSVQLLRVNARVQLDATASFTNLDVDAGTASFTETRGSEFSFSPLTSLPPIGSCTVFSAGGVSVSGLLSGQLPNVVGDARLLNAGTPLQISGPRGAKTIPRSTDGSYFNIIGGAVPLLGPPPQPLYLDPGDYTVTGPGGPDVGPFTARVRVPASVSWTNRDQLAQVTRSSGVTVNWSGGDPASQGITILGGNLDNASSAGAVFVCLADLRDGSFNVPNSILSALPPSNLAQPDQTTGFLAIGAGPSGDLPTFTATGLDAGYALFSQFNALSVVYR